MFFYAQNEKNHVCSLYFRYFPTTPPQNIGINPGGFATPRFWAGGRRGSWTGHKILYLIMHRKYVRKWLLLKRNRMICPEIAVSSQFLP